MTESDKIVAAIYAAVKCHNLQKLSPVDFLVHYNGMVEAMRCQDEHPEPAEVMLQKFASGTGA
jgi:hypothetical protein